MKNISRRNIGGFTLVEILVVVLIIGILSAVAVPMYQGAVDKSNFSTMLAPTRSLKEAQEGVRMATGNYTDNAEDLDVTLSQESLSYEFQTRDNGDEFNAIIATNPKLPNVRLARYLDENLLLAGQLHCEAKIGDERANKLCGPLLIGQEIKATGDGYMAYLLDEQIDQPTCDYAGKSFSTSKTKCYKDTATRCEALGMPAIAGQDQCGYKNAWGKTVGAEGICEANKANGCGNSIINEGGVCHTSDDESIGNSENENNFKCGGVVLNGGKCIAESSKGVYPCVSAVINEGGVCVGNSRSSCHQVIINNGGTCEGNYPYSCYGTTVNNGGKCVANTGGERPYTSCSKITVNDGGKCVANAPNTCGGTYNGTGCCEGAYCPADVPKC